MTHKKKSRLLYSIIVIIASGIFVLFTLYALFLKPNLNLQTDTYLFAVPSNSTVESIYAKLSDELHVGSSLGFFTLAKLVKLENRIYPGLYKLESGMSNKDIIFLLRSGKRESVNVTIKFGRYAQDIVKQVAPLIEADYDEMTQLLHNSSYMDSLGFNAATAICLFLPDTYQFHWNTSARGFFSRMYREYTNYWNSTRLEQAKSIGLSPHEVMTLASIVNQETNKNDEKKRVAGVYMNRIKTSHKLQADPTVKYAYGNFSMKRIYRKHLLINSPYNTYNVVGLPPGPICTPQKTDIEAVLNYEQHAYMFFCAKPDYSGYHVFSTSYNEHLKHAAAYSKWLNSERIR